MNPQYQELVGKVQTLGFKPTSWFEQVVEYDARATGHSARLFRQASGVTIREVAIKMGVSTSYVSNLEWGRRPWSFDTVVRYDAGVKAAALEERK